MKRLFVLLLVIVLVFTAAGCSGGQKTKTGPQETVRDTTDKIKDDTGKETAKPEKKEEQTVVKDFWKSLAIYDLATLFQELAYAYSVTKSDGKTSVSNLEFTVLAEKEIDGAKAYQIRYALLQENKETVIEFWAGKKSILEATINGQAVEGMDLLNVTVTLSSYMQAFIVSDVWAALLSKPDMAAMLGWKKVDEGAQTVNLGAGNITVRHSRYEVGNAEYSFGVTAIGGKNVFVNYKAYHQGSTYEYTVSRLIPR